jgi:HPt (histidine-containing phosphotransfer) domain-containing protein
MPSAPSDPEILFDRELALHHAGDEAELLRAVVQMFLDQASERLDALEAALREGDTHELERAAHSLKGTAATLALGRVRALSDELERMGAAGEMAGAPERLVELGEAIEEVLPALGEVLAPVG